MWLSALYTYKKYEVREVMSLDFWSHDWQELQLRFKSKFSEPDMFNKNTFYYESV